jgi:hypothetical protein
MIHIEEDTFKTVGIGFVIFIVGCYIIYAAISKRTKKTKNKYK